MTLIFLVRLSARYEPGAHININIVYSRHFLYIYRKAINLKWLTCWIKATLMQKLKVGIELA